MNRFIAIQSGFFNCYSMSFLYIKKMSVLFIFVVSLLSIVSAQTETDSLEALLPGLQGFEKIKVFEKLIELNKYSAPEKAIEFGKQTLQLLNHDNDETMRSNILNEMCFLYMHIGKDSIALKVGNESLQLAEKNSDRNGKAGALLGIGQIYQKSGKYQKALDYYSESLKIYEELNDWQSIGLLLKENGNIYEILGDYTQALAYYQKALNIFQKIDDKKGIAMVLVRIGYTHSYLGEYERALEYGLNSLKINEQIDDKMGIANSLGNIGNVYWRLGNNDKVLEYNLKSLKIKKEIGDKQSIAATSVNVGLAYAGLNDYNHALQYLSESLKLFEEIGDNLNTIRTLNNIGAIQFIKLNNKSALEYFIKSLKIAEEIGYKNGIAIAYDNIGAIYIKLGKYSEAINYVTKALAIGKNIKSKQLIKGCYKKLYEIYADMGKFKDALNYHKLFKSINDSIFTEESSKIIAEMQVKYDTEKKEKEIEILKNESTIKSLELDKQMNYRNMAMLSSVSILFVAILIFMGYRQKSKSNKLLNTLNEKLNSGYQKIKHQSDELILSKTRLEEINTELKSFSYSVSHDLKAPLRTVGGFLEILSEDYKDVLDSEAHRIIKIIIDSTQNMSQLITDLLDFSRIGNAQLKTSEIDMNHIAEEVFEELMQQYPERNINFESGGIPRAKGDKNLMRLVFTNLISNAIKFTAHNDIPEIKIGFKKKDNQTFYYVKDNGIGFDMNYIDKIFGVFQRLHTSDEFEGTGVGLAIVQKIIHKHGGEIWAKGEIDKGATFYFSLPENTSIN